MRSRKRKRIYVDGNGVEHIIDGPEIVLGRGSLEELLVNALSADEDDKVIKQKARELQKIINSKDLDNNILLKWYKVGKILGFVDNLALKDEAAKQEAFQRLFDDLKVDQARSPSIAKISRYPDHMYRLAKFPPSLVFYKGMNWSLWFDILEYRKICDNLGLLEDIIHRCCEEKWNSKTLRNELQKLNKSLK